MSNGDTTKTTAKPPDHNWERFDSMSGARRHATALSDPDAGPLSPDDFKRMAPARLPRCDRPRPASRA